MDDLEIVKSVLDGRREDYAVLVRKYQGKVRGLCLSLLNDAAEGDDAAQDVFIKIFSSLKNFRGTSSFSTWIYRIAVNHCRDALRKRTRRKTESLESLVEKRGEWEVAPARENPASDENRDLARRILSEISEDEREILLLRESQGLSYRELAEALDCSLEAVRSRLHRARQSLLEKSRHLLSPSDVQ